MRVRVCELLLYLHFNANRLAIEAKHSGHLPQRFNLYTAHGGPMFWMSPLYCWNGSEFAHYFRSLLDAHRKSNPEGPTASVRESEGLCTAGAHTGGQETKIGIVRDENTQK